ncbi:uncharacterized protein LOC132561625 [Ylistrum balloti]|uniref:uncharacterized protein LOC132561625 n=1 Tax=Ylistrum balloti TaxID=509963 RepID=UPI0029059C44|nr:uncharacterized protein LOC132561625 [Ylistrum balloti]
MVKRCAYGVCNSHDRYSERVEGISFHVFPKPKTNLEKCMRWIKLCNRPHSQLNVDWINKNTFVCSKHFVGGKGPTFLHPDPVPHTCGPTDTPKPTRLPPKRRKLEFTTPSRTLVTVNEENSVNKENVCTDLDSNTDLMSPDAPDHVSYSEKKSIATQTEHLLTSRQKFSKLDVSEIRMSLALKGHFISKIPHSPFPHTLPSGVAAMKGKAGFTTNPQSWCDPMALMKLTIENRSIHNELTKVKQERDNLKEHVSVLSKHCDQVYQSKVKQTCDANVQTKKTKSNFCVHDIIEDDKQFLYYTGFTPNQFLNVYTFLVPDKEEIPFEILTNRKTVVMELDLMNQLFLTVMKLRHDFGYIDLAFRYGIREQTTSIIFNTWINYMYLRFCELSIWPHRDVIKENMPAKFAEEFPSTFAIFDCTEIKIYKPSSLKVQSQTYSDYKSTNTLKGLVACDPRGSIIYASVLFSGGISDKEIFIKSKCKNLLKDLVDEGYLQNGNSVMADKGFNVEKELAECGLKLNIPPFARQGTQMSQADALLTEEIATHRVHVERAIARIKKFEILANRLPLTLFPLSTQI